MHHPSIKKSVNRVTSTKNYNWGSDGPETVKYFPNFLIVITGDINPCRAHFLIGST